MALLHLCLNIFRHFAQKSLDIRKYACEISIQSDEKSYCASAQQSLCGVALNFCSSLCGVALIVIIFRKEGDIACGNKIIKKI
jgi:hypothetical protein